MLSHCTKTFGTKGRMRDYGIRRTHITGGKTGDQEGDVSRPESHGRARTRSPSFRPAIKKQACRPFKHVTAKHLLCVTHRERWPIIAK